MAIVFGATFPKLRRLHIDQDPDLENVFSSDCPHMVLPELEKISLRWCKNIRMVFQNCPEQIQAAVPKLKSLKLYDLESLQSLCNCKLIEHWESLESLYVARCPNLKKLPHMTSIKVIEGREEW